MSEQIYQDFTTKLLPQIQTGLVITKDYFIDLFGRYIKYLIISDGVWLVIDLLVVVVLITKVIPFLVKKFYSYDEYDEFRLLTGIIITISGVIVFFATLSFFDNVDNLIKDFYIPEVRVYEEIKNMNECTNCIK